MADLNDILGDGPIETPKPAETPDPKAAPAAEVKDAKPVEKPATATGDKPDAAKADEGKAAPPAAAKDSEQGIQQALDAERAKRKDWKERALRLEGEIKAIKDREEAARKAAEAQPKGADGQPEGQGVPDPLLDPDGYANFIEQRAELRAINHTLNTSEARAVQKHGQELVNTAFEWAKTQVFAQNPAAYQRLIREADPYDVLVTVYQKQQRMAAIGDDPAKYEADLRTKIEAELREKILAEQAAGEISNPSKAQANPPPSLATARSAAARTAPGFSGPTPLTSILS